MKTNKDFKIKDLIEFIPTIHKDERGQFIETYNIETFSNLKFYHTFVQDNQSISFKNVFRGIHLQSGKFEQGKLVRVVKGSIIDYAVDLRPTSKTLGQYEKIKLTAEKGNMFWIPPGFGHAFLSLEDDTIVSYKCTQVYTPGSEVTIRYDDSDIGLQLPSDIKVSFKDQNGIYLKDYLNNL